MILAHKIKQIMNERNLTQTDLSRLLGIRQSQISNWLNSKSLPGYSSLKLLKEKLDIKDLFE